MLHCYVNDDDLYHFECGQAGCFAGRQADRQTKHLIFSENISACASVRVFLFVMLDLALDTLTVNAVYSL